MTQPQPQPNNRPIPPEKIEQIKILFSALADAMENTPCADAIEESIQKIASKLMTASTNDDANAVALSIQDALKVSGYCLNVALQNSFLSPPLTQDEIDTQIDVMAVLLETHPNELAHYAFHKYHRKHLKTISVCEDLIDDALCNLTNIIDDDNPTGENPTPLFLKRINTISYAAALLNKMCCLAQSALAAQASRKEYYLNMAKYFGPNIDAELKKKSVAFFKDALSGFFRHNNEISDALQKLPTQQAKQ
jgi:hypothetical protein